MSLLCWYKFSEEVNDVSGNNYHATNNGGTYVNTLGGKAMNLSGIDNYITIPTNINKTYTAFHIAFKIRLTKLPSNEGHSYHLLSLDSSTINIYISNSTDKLVFTTQNDAGTTVSIYATTTFLVGQDYDIQCNWDGNIIRMFIDKELEDNDNQSGSITPSGNNLFIGKYGILERNPEGYIDEFRLYDIYKSPLNIHIIASFVEYYDVRINGKSYSNYIINAKYGSSINTVSSEFEVELYDPIKALYNTVNDDDDVIIYQEGNIVYRGQVDIYTHKDGITTITGLDYTTILFSRYAIAKTYTAKTRQYIMQDLITNYLNNTKGSIYFTTSGIEELTTETLTIEYPNTSLAEIFLTFANEENGQIKTIPSISLPLVIEYKSNVVDSLQTISGVDVVLDEDSRITTTNGFTIYDLNFEQESRQVKNVFTIYGPASSRIAAEVRNEASILIYGEKRAEPITDVNATTVFLARKRALEEQTKWENPKQKGKMICNDTPTFVSGKTIKISSIDYGLTKDIFQIIDVEHISKDKKTILHISEVIRDVDIILADSIKKQREYDMRDTDTSAAYITSFVTNLIKNILTFTISISGTANISDNDIIGIGSIGVEAIGNQDTINLGTIIVDETMIITTLGLDALRNALTDNTKTLNATNTYLQFGYHTSDFDATLTESAWTGTYDLGNRIAVNLTTIVAATTVWDQAFNDTNLSGNPTVNKVAIFFGSSGGVLIAIANLSASITKVTGNNITPEITAILSDGGI